MAVDQREGGPVEFGRGACAHFAYQQIAALAFDQGHDTGTRAAQHRVDLPVAWWPTCLHRCGPFTEVPLARQPAATVVAAVAFALEFACSTQVQVQIASPAAVLPHVPLDRLMAERELAPCSQVAGYLFRTPLLA